MGYFCWITSITLGIVGIISEPYRILAWIRAAVLILVTIEIKNYAEIANLRLELYRQKEKLNIYKELIDIKSDIKMLNGDKG